MPGRNHQREDGTGLRVTNSLLYSRALDNTRNTLSEIERHQRSIASGLRVEKPSDDPKSLGEIMRSDSGLRALEQYKQNLSTGQSRLTLEEGVLEQVTNALTRAKELGVAQAGSTASAQTRQVAKEELEGIKDFVTTLGNTKFSGSFIFGGQYADTRPFSGSGIDPLKPPSGTYQVEGGAGAFYATNHSGQEIFVDTGVLDALDNMIQGLDTNSPTDIQAALTDLDSAFNGIQEVGGELGARMTQVETALSNLDALKVNLQTFRSDLADTEMEEAISQLVSRQVTYEAAMMTNARILQTSLTDYLR